MVRLEHLDVSAPPSRTRRTEGPTMMLILSLATTGAPTPNASHAAQHPAEHTLRLFGGVSKREGELQIYHDGALPASSRACSLTRG